MSKELTGHQILIILIGFALIGSFTGFILKSITSEKRPPDKVEEAPPPPPPPPPPPVITLQDMPSTMPFAFDIFLNSVKNKKENIVMSPYGAYSSMAMIYFGSEGETKSQIGSVLNLDNINEEDGKKLNQLLQNHISNSTDVNVLNANAFFMKRGPIIKEEFKEMANNYFSGEIDYLPETGKTINDWLNKKTEDKIDKIIGDGPISPLATSYLLSAVYFDAPWSKEVRKENTRNLEFNAPTEKKEVEMISITDSLLYLNDDEVKIITINYKNQSFSLHIIMPKKDLDTFYEALNERKLNNLKERMTKEEVEVLIPKFSFDKTIQLEEALRSMNVSSVLNPSTASLTGIIDASNEADEQLFIGNFLQKIVLKVEESEEEAVVSVEEVEGRQSPKKELIINNPFLFIIEETTTSTIILMGQITDPSL